MWSWSKRCRLVGRRSVVGRVIVEDWLEHDPLCRVRSNVMWMVGAVSVSLFVSVSGEGMLYAVARRDMERGRKGGREEGKARERWMIRVSDG